MIARSMLGLFAPILTYSVDEILEYAPKAIKGDCEDVFGLVYEELPEINAPFNEEYMIEAREKFFEIVDNLKKEKKIKSTLELVIFSNSDELKKLSGADGEDWFTVSNVICESQSNPVATFSVEEDEFKIYYAKRFKCPRCWKHRAKEEDGLCSRCSGTKTPKSCDSDV